MFRMQQLTYFGTPDAAAAPELSPAIAGRGTWAQTGRDPFFVEIDPVALGYRSAPRGFARSVGRRSA